MRSVKEKHYRVKRCRSESVTESWLVAVDIYPKVLRTRLSTSKLETAPTSAGCALTLCSTTSFADRSFTATFHLPPEALIARRTRIHTWSRQGLHRYLRPAVIEPVRLVVCKEKNACCEAKRAQPLYLHAQQLQRRSAALSIGVLIDTGSGNISDDIVVRHERSHM